MEPRNEAGETEAVPALGVLILYEDLPTGVRAMTRLKNLMSQVPEVQVHLSVWRFDVLTEAVRREQAAQKAAQSRIVMVSAHGQDDLPEGTKALLDQWLDVGPGLPSALVVSLDAGSEASGAGETRLTALLNSARRAGVDVFAQPGTAPSPESNFMTWDATQPTEAASPKVRHMVFLSGASCHRHPDQPDR